MGWEAKPFAASSDWDGHEHAQVRLIAGTRSGEHPVPMALEIAMPPGWYTYWRHPGMSGIAPSFDWRGSYNLRHVEVLWPVPERAREFGLDTQVYRDRAILPLRILPRSQKKDVTLRLTLNYAVCKDICVPAQAELTYVLPARDRAMEAEEAGRHRRVIAEALEAIPSARPRAMRMAIERAVVSQSRDGALALYVHAKTWRKPEDPDVFVDGPKSLAFAAPNLRWVEQVRGAKHSVVFRIPIHGAKSERHLAHFLARPVRIVLSDAGRAVEQLVPVEYESDMANRLWFDSRLRPPPAPLPPGVPHAPQAPRNSFAPE